MTPDTRVPSRAVPVLIAVAVLVVAVLGVAAAFTIVAGAVLVIGCTGGRDFSCGFWGG